jgi:hypothetical protein
MQDLVIHQSLDYSKFSFVVGNRQINEEKVKEYVEMLEKGYSHDECPILVTKKMEILDGQHRFLAAKQKNLPIFYLISKKTAESDAMIDINRSSNNWKIEDYVLSYAKRGNENYQKLKEFCHKNKISYGLGVICSGYSRKKLKNLIIDNQFVYNEALCNEAQKSIENYRALLSKTIFLAEKNIYLIFASYSFLEAILVAKSKTQNFFEVLFENRNLIKHSSGFKNYVAQFVALGICAND